jgi:hypothetical protein
MMKTAIFIRDLPTTRTGATQKLWRLSEPLVDEVGKGFNYVVTSAVNAPFSGSGPETYIFPADTTGKVLDWLELPGSFRGALDHERAIRGAGYSIVERDDS